MAKHTAPRVDRETKDWNLFFIRIWEECCWLVRLRSNKIATPIVGYTRVYTTSFLNEEADICLAGKLKKSSRTAEVDFVNKILAFHIEQIDSHLATNQFHI